MANAWPSAYCMELQGLNESLVGLPTTTNYNNHGDIMRSLFTKNTVSKVGNSANNQTPNDLPNLSAGNRPDSRPPLAWYNGSVPSGRSPVRGNDESILMRSQL